AYFDVRASKLGDGLTYIFRDVTDRVQSALDLEEKTRELERSNRELQSFAYIASHDLQEPLRKIRTFGERVETLYAEALGSRGLDHLRRIRAAAARMGDLLDGLLEYSRVSHRPSTMEPVALDLLVPRVLDDLEVAVAASGAVIEVGRLPRVIGNPAQLHGLFQNLLANAIKFRHAERPPRVEVCAGEHLNGQVWVVVRDNGIGFEPQYAERLFEPFQRLHTLDEYAGAGMGLASARRVAERHGGRIEARGELGVGAEFRVLLPADPGADEVAPSEPNRPA
ncbi:MAG: hypothetical protein HUU35_10995, partial [Armatimonadetes bacterium]|nr:hypothetical protein [Armatimonadota bacterium]